MKTVFKRIVAVAACFVLLVGFAPLDGFAGLFSGRASAASYSVGQIISFGMYPQDDITDTYLSARLAEQVVGANGRVSYGGRTYFKIGYKFCLAQPIRWRVLRSDPDGVLVLSEKVLDAQPYHAPDRSITWENCTLRSWLNNDFYSMAFSSSEKNKINLTYLTNGDNPSYGTPGGNPTFDRVFLLSLADALEPAFGFSSSTSSSSTRRAYPTAYARSRGVSYDSDGAYWWLRTPGYSSDRACDVTNYGNDIHSDSYVGSSSVGVRPALKLNLTSGIFQSKSYSLYTVRAEDGATNQPLNGAAVYYNGSAVGTTDANGVFTVNVGSGSDPSNEIVISKDGYSSERRCLYELDPYATNTMALKSNVSFDLSEVLADAQFAKEKVTGPTVKIVGKSFPLFSVDASLEFGSVSFKSKQNTKEKTVQYIIGIKDGVDVSSDEKYYENYRDFKNFFNSFSNGQNWNAYNKIRDKLKKNGGSVAFDADLSVAGYMEFDYSSGDLVLKEGGMVVTAEATVSQNVPFWGVFYGTFKIGGEIEGKLYATLENSGALQMRTSLAIALKPSLGVGIGNSKIACLEAGVDGEIKGEIKLPASKLRDALSISLSAQVYFKAKLLFLEGKWSTNFPSLQLYPDFGTIKANSIDIDESDFKMIPRDYLAAKGLSAQSISDDLSEENVYPYGEPKLTRLNDGRIVAMWIKDDGSKSDANRTTLYFSVYSDGLWSAPEALDESGRADLAPEIYSDGENIHALWKRGTEVFEDGATLDDSLSKVQLLYARFDGEQWSEPENVGNHGNGKYPILSSIAADGENVTIAWAENSLNAYDFSEGEAYVYTQSFASGAWGEPTLVANPLNVIGLAAGYDGATATAAWSVDTDGDISTDGDCEVFVGGTQLTSNVVDDIAVSYHDGEFYYLNGGMLASKSGGATQLEVTENYQLVGNSSSRAVIYPISDGFKNELYVSYFTEDGYTLPVALTDIGKHISDYSAVMDSDGTIVAAMDVDNLSQDSNEYPYTTTDFVVTNIGSFADLEINEFVSVDEDEVEIGNTVPFTATVRNIGTKSLTGYILNIRNAANEVVASRMFEDTIASGESKEIFVAYTIPDGFARQTLTVEVVSEQDANSVNNTALLDVGFADICVASCSVNNGVLSATAANNGFETAQNVTAEISRFVGEENLLHTVSLGTLAPGEIKTVTYTLPDEQLEFASAYVSNKFSVKLSTDSDEYNTADNAMDTLVSPIPVESITLSAQQLSLLRGETAQLTATVYPSEAFNKKVYWVSDATNVVAVDSDGTLTAVGGGTAIITAISDSGDFIAQCEVDVSVNITSISMTAEAATVNCGETKALSYVIDPDAATNKDVEWTSSNVTVATVSSTGVVSALKSGQTTVTVKTLDGSFTSSCLITVVKPVKGISISDVNVMMYLDGTKKLTAQVTPADADNKEITWKSSNDYVASVDGSGNVSAVGTGTATITATSVDGDYRASCTVTVGKHVSNILLSDNSMILTPGFSKKLSATVLPLNATNKAVEWVSVNTGIATVDQSGNVTAVSSGTTSIIASTEDGGFYAVCEVFVCSGVVGYSLNSPSEVMAMNSTLQLSGTFTPADAENQAVTWRSSDAAVASVDSNGLVSSKKAGTAVIIATTVDGGYIDYCLVHVVGVVPQMSSQAVVDAENGFIYGLAVGISSVEDYISVADTSCAIDCDETESGFGTQTVVNLTRDSEVIESYTVVVFGDVNGDGIYDGSDAATVNEIVDEGLTAENVGEAVYLAADCNHDGAVDENDVTMLNRAGTYLDSFSGDTQSEKWTIYSCYISQSGAEGSFESMRAAVPSEKMTCGGKMKLKAVYALAKLNAQVEWTSSDTSVAEVGADGIVTANDFGQVTITAEDELGRKAYCNIQVVSGKANISLNSTNGSTSQKVAWWKKYSTAKMQLKYTAFGCSDAVSYVWSSDNSRVRVDQEGNVTNIGAFARSATITLTALDAKGNVVASNSVKVEFYKFNWQKQRLTKQAVVSDSVLQRDLPDSALPDSTESPVTAFLNAFVNAIFDVFRKAVFKA